MDLYDDLLVQLLAALGAALFVGNALALVRRRSDARAAPARRARSNRQGSDSDLDRAPLARTLAYMIMGFVVMLAGLGALLN